SAGTPIAAASTTSGWSPATQVDLCTRDVLPAPPNDILLACDEPEVAVGIHPCQVAGQEKAVAERGCGGFRIAIITLHDRRRAHPDLAGSADRDFVEIIIDYSYFGEVHRRIRVQARLAHRAPAPFAVERVAARAGDLRHAIAFDEMRHTELLFVDMID